METENGQLQVLEESTVGIPTITFTRDQIELIKRTVAKDTNDDELKLFLYQAKRIGLDPLAKQIHCVKRGGQISIQTAIDGYRLIADRTGKYAGNDDPVFDDEAKPQKATVTVYKIAGGERCPFTATARWSQYCPTDDKSAFMWKKMPHLMLGKCAEALALRKAFPAELSGLYTDDEMAQAGVSHESKPAIAEPKAKQEVKPATEQKQEGPLTVTFVPVSRSEKKDKNGHDRFSVKSPNGEWYSTGNEHDGATIIDAAEKKVPVVLEYAINGTFLNIISAKLYHQRQNIGSKLSEVGDAQED